MIDKTVNEIDYDSLAEDECDGAQQNVIELKMRQMRPGLQKRAYFCLFIIEWIKFRTTQMSLQTAVNRT